MSFLGYDNARLIADGGAQALWWSVLPHGDHAHGICGSGVVSVYGTKG